MKRTVRFMLAIAAAATLAQVVLRVLRCWPDDAYFGHTTGVWFALADDFRHGTFYRPLFGPLGYGGTRYAPLYFMILGGFMDVARSPFVAGHILQLVSVALLLGGAYALLRALSVNRFIAVCATVLVLASLSCQLMLLGVWADALAAAFIVWGLTLCVAAPEKTIALAGAALLFTAAFATKVTSLYGAGVGFLFLMFSGHKKQAWQLSALVAALVFMVVGGVDVATGGRIYHILKDSASGGSSWHTIIRSPKYMALMIMGDPGMAPFFVLGAGTLVYWPGKALRELPPLLFLGAVATDLVIYGSPGTYLNHLVDIQVAAIIAIAVWIAHSDESLGRMMILNMAIAGLLAVIHARSVYAHADTTDRRHQFEAILRFLGPHPGPILSEDPLLPILAHQRPYVEDPFMLRAIGDRQPSFRSPLFTAIEEHKFSAIVLQLNPNSREAHPWYDTTHFGGDFTQVVDQNYQVALSFPSSRLLKGEYVLVPRAPVEAPEQ